MRGDEKCQCCGRAARELFGLRLGRLADDGGVQYSRASVCRSCVSQRATIELNDTARHLLELAAMNLVSTLVNRMIKERGYAAITRKGASLDVETDAAHPAARTADA